jgi:hypothetical protein
MDVDQLARHFDQLSATDQKEFFRRVMATLCERFKSEPQQMMAEMMPLCREMMQGCGMDPQKMMGMMAQMKAGDQGRQ